MRNILVIEDSKTINNIIKKELSKFKFKVSQAFTLSEAKKFLNLKKFHLIILDLHLPDGEGSELIVNIQSLTKTKVVVLTSSQDNELREELFQYGILDYIIKDKNLLYSISEIIKILYFLSSRVKEKILIIDDSKFICKQVRVILEPRNYVINSAYSAKEALEKLDGFEYNLIILDMELPDMSGIKLLELIRKDKRFLEVPIIVLSGTLTPETLRIVLKNGANDFLRKPFVFEEFVLKIDLWIDYFKKEKELVKKTSELEYINKNLKKLVDEEVEKNRKKDELMFAQSRYAQMGETIAMIAHQWKQPLHTIGMAISAIDMKLPREIEDIEMMDELISRVYKNIDYLTTTIDDFREFFKPQKVQKTTNYKIILDKAFLLLKSSLDNKNINFEVDTKELTDFLSYENELIQVVLNIFKNAQDSLIDNKIEKPCICVEIDKKTLHISDNAGGIPNDIIDKVFDPYFSTKDNSNGTGLGLYMSKIIVEEHCLGSLSVENTDTGARFTISL